MHIAGLDIGFSKTRRSNALAVLRDDELTIRKLTIAERDEALATQSDIDLIAIDAPLMPPSSPEQLVRSCEAAFVRGLFQKRCKPGMSHVRGTGRELRAHGSTSASRSRTTLRFTDASFPRINDHAVVEAFPNAFLGVAVPDHTYRGVKIRRGGKFDWLYDQWVSLRLFEDVLFAAGMPSRISTAFYTETDHDRRAALICLLTAAFVATGRYVAVGDPEGGYFFLLPQAFWSDWAWRDLERVSSQSGAEVHVR
jgi:hypothetical protein